jgi:hypothetical protein
MPVSALESLTSILPAASRSGFSFIETERGHFDYARSDFVRQQSQTIMPSDIFVSLPRSQSIRIGAAQAAILVFLPSN